MKKSIITSIIALNSALLLSTNAFAATHTVVKGDSIAKISSQCGLNLKDLLNANPWILNPECIIPGQVIIIPGHGAICPDQDVTVPDQDVTVPDQDQAVPDQDVTVPDQDQAVPDQDVTVPDQDVIVPDQDQAVPDQDQAVPDQDITTPDDGTGAHSFESEVVRLVNEIRTSNGLNELIHDEALSNVARIKSQDMKDNNYFSHTSPTYGSPFDMMNKFGISYRAAGENIAKGQRTPQEVVNAWMNSTGHRENILNANYTHIGVGYVDGGNYWTQMFIGK